MRGFIIRRDHSLMHRVNSWDAPRWMRAYAISSTRAGDGWLWYAMGVLILLFGGEERYRALGAAGLAAIFSILLFMVLKRFANRRRPCEINAIQGLARRCLRPTMHVVQEIIGGGSTLARCSCWLDAS